ncbi:prosaposin-like [Narcine bancroftii]|uniref:prosaposin-like n=1 Tax=Narcine bancroftii TaxID=1343680 RepID=UPI003831EAE6
MAALALFVLLSFSSVLASSELKNKLCAQGPEYWCQDLKAALQCGAIEHCFENKWTEPGEEAQLCELCKQIFRIIERMIKQQRVKNCIKNIFIKVCSLISSNFITDQCDQYVDVYFNHLFQLIMHQLRPEVLCAFLSICKPEQPVDKQEALSNAIPQDEPSLTHHLSSPVFPVSQENHQEGVDNQMPQCALCLYVVSKLVNVIPEEKTEATIVKVLDEFCTHLPESFSERCTTFVDKYGKEIIELLLQKIGPNAVCMTLHLCFSKDIENSVALYELRDGVSCGTCDNLAHRLRVAQKNGTEVDVLLVEACGSLSGTSRFVCEDFIHSYKPQLRLLLQKSQEEKDICAELGVCLRKKSVNLLGENECTWGPSHWCKDLETATRCNAVQHCKQHKWNHG